MWGEGARIVDSTEVRLCRGTTCWSVGNKKNIPVTYCISIFYVYLESVCGDEQLVSRRHLHTVSVLLCSLWYSLVLKDTVIIC